jgi:hypothetical protein
MIKKVIHFKRPINLRRELLPTQDTETLTLIF